MRELETRIFALETRTQDVVHSLRDQILRLRQQRTDLTEENEKMKQQLEAEALFDSLEICKAEEKKLEKHECYSEFLYSSVLKGSQRAL